MVKYPIAIFSTLLGIAGFFIAQHWGQSWTISWTIAVTLVVATLWMTEALPIPVTSLLPFVLLPLGDVLSHKQAAMSLGSPVILLLMAAFMLSKGVEKSNVHKRFALYMIRVTGGGSSVGLICAFAIAAALLSMWISNTATTLMMLPIALAIVKQIDQPRVAVSVLLAIAYGSSIGGIATPIGTPPNVIFMSAYEDAVGQTMAFTDWMAIGLPITALALPTMLLVLTYKLPRVKSLSLPQLGQWRTEEIRVLIIFALVVLAWITRVFWGKLAGLQGIGDSTIALAGVLLMCLTPSGNTTINQAEYNNDQGMSRKGSSIMSNSLLDWDSAKEIPWGMLLLFAGGICLAKGFSESGLSELIGQSFTSIAALPLILTICVICLLVTFLTEITSNTATAVLLMPILASVAIGASMDPLLLMIPAVASASCAFMLPVATAPNAIVYSSGHIAISTMAKQGIVINIAVGLVIAFTSYLLLD